jgi:hypothetical protein
MGGERGGVLGAEGVIEVRLRKVGRRGPVSGWVLFRGGPVRPSKKEDPEDGG